MSRAAFARRRGVNRKRVDAACELADKRFVDHAVALESTLPAERLRHDIYPEMSLPALAMSSMPSVLVGFVHHVEARRSESLGQLLRDEVSSCHGVRIAVSGPAGQCRFRAPPPSRSTEKSRPHYRPPAAQTRACVRQTTRLRAET